MGEEPETEHGLAPEGLAKLRELEDQPGFGTAVDMLAAVIEHHVREEADEIFPSCAATPPIRSRRSICSNSR